MTAASLLTSAWSHWTTPDDVLTRVRCVGPIDLDPCGNPNDQVKAFESWHGPAGTGKHRVDGLATSWMKAGRGLIYTNPPYGRTVQHWIEKAAREGAAGAEVILLVPARTDTAWWHEQIVGFCNARCFWRGRLRFGNQPPGKGGGESSTFPSALVYWGRSPYAFGAAFDDAGEVVIG